MRVKAIVKYKGTNYHGWQKQIGDRTIQGEIEEVLSKVLDTNISIYASGRTDAGVHALGQVFHFDTLKEDIDLNRLRYSINMMLDNDIEILSLERVSDNFHSRYDVKVKKYEYKIKLKSKDPFNYQTSYICPYPLDINLFETSIKKFIGKHDFRNLTSKEIDDEQDFIREIYSIDFNIDKEDISIIFTGNGFMRYMIRYMVGVALAISMKKEDITYIDEILDNKDRKIISYKAPAEGLYLVEVTY